MQGSNKRQIVVILALLQMFTSGIAAALPTNLRVIPPNRARFLTGQKFDIRVEARGTGPFSASIAIDGVPQRFTSGEQDSVTTDGISSPGYGGFNLRGYSTDAPGCTP